MDMVIEDVGYHAQRDQNRECAALKRDREAHIFSFQ